VIIGTKGVDNLSARRGDDVIRGRGGDDNALRGDGGADKIKGAGGEDHLDGGKGQDILKGGKGYDFYSFQENNWGQEVIEDVPIIDTDLDRGQQIRFDDVTLDLVVNMNSGAGHEVTALEGTATLDWENDLIDIVLLGDGDDSVTGRPIADNIQLFGGGEDVIQSGAGDDFVYMLDGEPNDAVSCGPGTNDQARVDPGDSVDADCELLTRRR
jgi:Ca2+-binding RTX toxin-like protein